MGIKDYERLRRHCESSEAISLGLGNAIGVGILPNRLLQSCLLRNDDEPINYVESSICFSRSIVDVIRKNTTVDWSKRDDVRARLRLTVKKF